MSKCLKLLALILVLAVMCSVMSLLAGCARDGETAPSQSSDDAQNKEDPGGSTEASTQPTIQPAPSEPEPMDPNLLYNSHGVKLTYLDTETDSESTYLNFRLENTGDGTALVFLMNLAVNGFRTPCEGFGMVESGADNEISIEIPLALLSVYGVEALYDAVFDVSLKDDQWEDVDDQTVSLTLAEGVQEYNREGEILVEENGLLITLQSCALQEDGLFLTYYAENTSENETTFILDDVTVNGCCCSDYSAMYVTLRSGERTVYSVLLGWMSAIKVEKESQLQNLALTVRAFCPNDADYLINRRVRLALGDEAYRYQPAATKEIFNDHGLRLELSTITPGGWYATFQINAWLEGFEEADLYLDIVAINDQVIGSYANLTLLEDTMGIFLLDCWYDDALGFTAPSDINTITFTLSSYGEFYLEETFTIQLK